MKLRLLVGLLLLSVVSLVFTAFLVVAFGNAQQGEFAREDLITILVLFLGFLGAGLVAPGYVIELFRVYLQDFHDLSEDDAVGLTQRLLFGLPLRTSNVPTLRIRSGMPDPAGPPVIHKVGGPAKLNVDHDNVVVTSRIGRLHRVLGPGSYELDSFERVWDVIDLRPQRRALVVEFMSREGIPASCEAGIVCRAAIPKEFPPSRPDAQPGGLAGYARRTALVLTTSKYVRRLEGADRVTDWVSGIANGALGGTVRDTLEQYSLNELVNPQHWLDAEERPARIAAQPKLLTDLEMDILDKVRATAKQRGVIVESVSLGPVQPDEETVSRQWLQFWQARLQRRVDDYAMAAELTQKETIATARAEVQADFIKRVLQRVEQLRREEQMVPNHLILESVSEVLNSMYDWSPEARRALFQQGEALVKFVEKVLYGPVVAAPITNALPDESKPPKSPDTIKA